MFSDHIRNYSSLNKSNNHLNSSNSLINQQFSSDTNIRKRCQQGKENQKPKNLLEQFEMFKSSKEMLSDLIEHNKKKMHIQNIIIQQANFSQKSTRKNNSSNKFQLQKSLFKNQRKKFKSDFYLDCPMQKTIKNSQLTQSNGKLCFTSKQNKTEADSCSQEQGIVAQLQSKIEQKNNQITELKMLLEAERQKSNEMTRTVQNQFNEEKKKVLGLTNLLHQGSLQIKQLKSIISNEFTKLSSHLQNVVDFINERSDGSQISLLKVFKQTLIVIYDCLNEQKYSPIFEQKVFKQDMKSFFDQLEDHFSLNNAYETQPQICKIQSQKNSLPLSQIQNELSYENSQNESLQEQFNTFLGISLNDENDETNQIEFDFNTQKLEAFRLKLQQIKLEQQYQNKSISRIVASLANDSQQDVLYY